MKFRCHNLNSLLLSGLMPWLLCGCSLKKDHKEAVHNIRNDIVLSDSIDMTSIRKDKETINIRETYDSLSGMIREKEISFVASSIDSQRDKVRRKDVLLKHTMTMLWKLKRIETPPCCWKRIFYSFCQDCCCRCLCILNFITENEKGRS